MKLNKPLFDFINIGNIAYFGDSNYSSNKKSLMEEFFYYSKYLFDSNIHFINICTHQNFNELLMNLYRYDVIMFDYGSDISKLTNYFKIITNLANENPNKDFVAVGCFIDVAIKFMKEDLNLNYFDPPNNLYLSLDDFIDKTAKISINNNEDIIC